MDVLALLAPISFLPQKHYLSKHPWQEEVIQSLVPTLLVALLTVLVPLLLLLIAQKAHNVATVSALHDVILTRYYKFLIVNVLVFFCVGTAFVQTLLKATGFTNRQDILHTIATTFPTAGPFYVGWRASCFSRICFYFASYMTSHFHCRFTRRV